MDYHVHKFLSDISYILAIFIYIFSLYDYCIGNMPYATFFLVYTILFVVNGNLQFQDYLRTKKRGE